MRHILMNIPVTYDTVSIYVYTTIVDYLPVRNFMRHYIG